MTSTLHLKSVAESVERKRQGGFIPTKKHGTKKWSQPRFISSIMQTAPWKHIFGSRSFICASKHLRSTPSDMFRVAYSWETVLKLMGCEVIHQEVFSGESIFIYRSSDGWEWRSFLVRAPLHANKKQLLLCRPLGGETFKKVPQFNCGHNWNSSINYTGINSTNLKITIQFKNYTISLNLFCNNSTLALRAVWVP